MHPSFANFEQRLRDAFGHHASCERPLASSRLGARLHGVDLSAPLTAPQVELLLDGLSHFRLLTIPGQDLGRFSLAHFERFANHWGAPVPHPSNFLRGGKPAQQDGISDGKIEYMPFAERRVAVANATLPDQLQCMRHESPAVLVATNLLGERNQSPPSNLAARGIRISSTSHCLSTFPCSWSTMPRAVNRTATGSKRRRKPRVFTTTVPAMNSCACDCSCPATARPRLLIRPRLLRRYPSPGGRPWQQCLSDAASIRMTRAGSRRSCARTPGQAYSLCTVRSGHPDRTSGRR